MIIRLKQNGRKVTLQNLLDNHEDLIAFDEDNNEVDLEAFKSLPHGRIHFWASQEEYEDDDCYAIATGELEEEW
jgi:hypothetical protein